MNEKRGIWMAGKLAEEQINNAGCDFDCYNAEFVQSAHTVGWAYLHNDGNFAFQKSYGCENLTDKNTSITPLSTLTTAPYGAETRMNRAFAGGGGV